MLILDEPANGLDPAGIAWLRQFLRALAAEGRTVLVSSHVLSEVQQTVDDVVVIARGRLVRQGTLAVARGRPGRRARADADARACCATRSRRVRRDGGRTAGSASRGARPTRSATSRTAPASSCTS